MTFKQEIDRILEIDSNLDNYTEQKIINNCYLIDGGRLCYNYDLGDARYPYVHDGKALWCHQNGNISLNESALFTIQEVIEGEANRVAFFLGIKNGKTYDFHSLFSLNSTIFPKNARRVTFFKDSHAVYLLKVNDIIYALRITLGFDKKLYYELYIRNENKTKVSLYSSMFLNLILLHGNHTSVETKWFRKAEYKDNNFITSTVEDRPNNKHIYNFAKVRRCFSKELNFDIYNTTSRRVYANSKANRIEASECLVEGKFFEEKHTTCFSDIAIDGDIIRFDLDPNEDVKIGYSLTNYDSENDCLNDTSVLTNEALENTFNTIEETTKKYWNSDTKIKFNFGESDKINSTKFNLFVDELIKQVDYCALTKNSTMTMLGVRDIFQAIEAGLIWNRKDARRKILEALNFIGLNGRSPRQYSLPPHGETVAAIDDREFIDQGLWIIDAVYQYLVYSDDYDFLNEICGYAEMNDDGLAHLLDKKESVLEHLIRICNYLTSNIDENTHCLKTLYGDWNDAINGLGASSGNEKFGNGVSIMASFQLYSVLDKINKILTKVDALKYQKQILTYKNLRNVLENGLKENAFVSDGKGNHKILHGWGNNKEFLVGSFDDIDHQERDTLTSNAFYILSGYSDKNPEYVKDVLKAYDRLDSKYGYKTFDPYFDKDSWKVGRIVNLPKGTAENAATYIHATVFALDSLFMINEDEKAWNQIFKIVPITHKFVTTTPFIMPNSYVYNEELGCDGESMNDWFTGSSSTLLKSLVKNAFGIQVGLDDITIKLANYLPFKTASFEIKPCRTQLFIKYLKKEGTKKEVKVNGKTITDFEVQNGKKILRFNKKDLPNSLIIEVEI